MTRRLCRAALGSLPATVQKPLYDRNAVAPGIVHIGPGAFHRVHQAWFAEQWLATDPRWGIAGISLRSPDLREALAPQDWLYTLAVVDAQESLAVIGALCEVLVAAHTPTAALQRIASPDARLITLTVTEKGYCLDVTGQLDVSHPDIRHDLDHPHEPRSAVGFVVEGLRLRREQRLPPLPVMSCDNLAGNGRLLAAAVRNFSAERDAGLAAWIEAEIAFPCSMVDSITPATTAALRERVAGALGMEDAWPVQREAFVQWVIEEHRTTERPEWERAGVIVTQDVAGYEQAKLRLLNGAHSTLAYVGLLRGHATVVEAMRDPPLLNLVRDLLFEDVVPTLPAVQGLDHAVYIETVLRRFSNPAMRHELAQIAWDGSKKLPVRLLGTVRDALAQGRPIDRLCMPLAAWMHFVRGRFADGLVLVDPLAARLKTLAASRTDGSPGDVVAFLELAEVFPDDLAAAVPFRDALIRAYVMLGADGAVLT